MIHRLLHVVVVVDLLMLVGVHYIFAFVFLFYFRFNHNINDKNPQWHEIAALKCGLGHFLPRPADKDRQGQRDGAHGQDYIALIKG